MAAAALSSSPQATVAHSASRSPTAQRGPTWGPKGWAHGAPRAPCPPGGFFGPFGAPRAPSGAPGDSGGAPGAPRRLRGHFWEKTDFGLPAAPGLRGGGGLAAAPSGLAAAPSPCCPASGLPRRDVFLPARMTFFFGNARHVPQKKKVLREGSPGPGTPLDRRGPRFRIRGCAGEQKPLTKRSIRAKSKAHASLAALVLFFAFLVAFG